MCPLPSALLSTMWHHPPTRTHCLAPQLSLIAPSLASQDLSQLQTRKMKGLKRPKKTDETDEVSKKSRGGEAMEQESD